MYIIIISICITHTCGAILLEAPIESVATIVNVNMTRSVKVTVNMYS